MGRKVDPLQHQLEFKKSADANWNRVYQNSLTGLLDIDDLATAMQRCNQVDHDLFVKFGYFSSKI